MVARMRLAQAEAAERALLPLTATGADPEELQPLPSAAEQQPPPSSPPLQVKLITLLEPPFAVNRLEAQMKRAIIVADAADGASLSPDFAFDVSLHANRSLSSGLGLLRPPPTANPVFAAAAARPQVRTFPIPPLLPPSTAGILQYTYIVLVTSIISFLDSVATF